jgi:hypothetical protein
VKRQGKSKFKECKIQECKIRETLNMGTKLYYVTGVITLDTEDYLKKERICEMETTTATFTHLVSRMTPTPIPISLSCMMVLNVSYNLLNATGIKQPMVLLSLASDALTHCAWQFLQNV